jgi:hypothetical protein
MIEELWLTDNYGRPFKLTREVRDRQQPIQEEIDAHVHYENQQQTVQEVQQTDVPQQVQVQLPIQEEHIQRPHSDFERRVQRGNDYRPFSYKPFHPPVFSLRDEYGNQRSFTPINVGMNVLSPRFFNRRIYSPFYEEIEQDETGQIISYRKHFYIPKYTRL